MTTETTYNGWTNYETWAVKLWLDNDEYVCNDWQPAAARGCDGDEHRLADAVEEFVTDPENGLIPALGATLAADLMNAALSEVNWREIAENMLEAYAEENQEEVTEEA